MREKRRVVENLPPLHDHSSHRNAHAHSDHTSHPSHHHKCHNAHSSSISSKHQSSSPQCTHYSSHPLHRSQLTAYERAHMSKVIHNPSNAPGVYSQYSFFFKSALSQSRMEEICTWIEGFSALEKKMLSDILNDCRDQVQWDCNDTL